MVASPPGPVGAGVVGPWAAAEIPCRVCWMWLAHGIHCEQGRVVVQWKVWFVCPSLLLWSLKMYSWGMAEVNSQSSQKPDHYVAFGRLQSDTKCRDRPPARPRLMFTEFNHFVPPSENTSKICNIQVNWVVRLSSRSNEPLYVISRARCSCPLVSLPHSCSQWATKWGSPSTGAYRGTQTLVKGDKRRMQKGCQRSVSCLLDHS